MAKYLVVVESPAKAKTIEKFLGRNYVVRACFGAVRDLPKSQLGVDTDNNFEPKYITLREERARKALKEIKDKAAKMELVLLASDPDREGEAIAWHVAEVLKAYKKTAEVPCSRIVFHEITKKNVKDAVGSPRSIDQDLVDAQQARRVIDRLVGYKLSPLLGWVIRKGLSAGRVQSVAVRMVVEREEEIRAFKPEEYWTVDATLLSEREHSFPAHLHKRDGESVALGKPGQIRSEDDANRIVADLQGASFSIQSIQRKEVKRNPKAPFITSSLQQEASRKLGMSPARSMSIAQQLYQGIEIGGEGQTGLITYMRTDSLRIADEAIQDVRAYIGSKYEAEMLPKEPNVYKNKKSAQDAHEAIRPSLTAHTPESMSAYLSEDQLKLYSLIWKRFVASQMPPAILDQTAIEMKAKNYEFRTTGTVTKFAGFTRVYEETDEGERRSNGANRPLPELNEGESVTVRQLAPEQHFTKPPPRFSEAALIRAMEENGIGRPSTYAPTMATIVARMYVAKENGRLVPTELGEEVNAWLVKNFPDVLSIDFTARLEEKLDNVEEGKQEWHALTREFYEPFSRRLQDTEKRMVAELVGKDPRCPTCDAPAELRQAWFGMYMGCTRYPECKGTIRVSRTPPEPTDEICPKCSEPMVIRIGRYGKFISCSTFPKCDAVISLDKEGNKLAPLPPPRETDETCPKCKEGNLLIRTSRKGEEFYGCERYPKCRFTRPMELNLPCPRPGCTGTADHNQEGRRRFIGCSVCDLKVFGKPDLKAPCSKCGTSWTTSKKPRNKPRLRLCPNPDCAHEEEIVETDE
ncbi:MAG: type I DNA topoisomerase [Candidatus Hydrogenedentes bacterium]|nr:type I DNA topoisomerase [Candidatus Hydrogenedentota bacterium]